MYVDPKVSDFQAYFYRDFPYGDCTGEGEDDLDNVLPQDITKAFGEAKININPALFSSQASYTIGFLYLTAHYLVTDLRMAAQGVAGSYSWLTTNKTVGNVSEAFGIPQRILDRPYFAMLTKTNFGAKYLSLLLPRLNGVMAVVVGTTLP